MRNVVLGLLSVAILFTAFVVTSDVASALNKCGGVDVAILPNCGDGGGDDIENSAVWFILTLALNILAGLVGVAAVGGIVYGAIMYSSAQDNANQVQEAIGIIRNVVIGLVLFIVMFAALQYLIPGGIFAVPPSP